MEGDTPSFLNLISNGLNSPQRPPWGGWGGRYELYTPRMQKWHLQAKTRPIWTDADDEVLGHDNHWHTDNHATIWRWRQAYQNDFAARMDWTIRPVDQANHPPIAKLGHPNELTAELDHHIELSAEGSSDPDGDALSYEWFCYLEAGSLAIADGRDGQPILVAGFDQPRPSPVIPNGSPMAVGSLHIILAVTDHGTPRLTRYQRVIIDVATASGHSVQSTLPKRPSPKSAH
jgi:hypothetical protein